MDFDVIRNGNKYGGVINLSLRSNLIYFNSYFIC